MLPTIDELIEDSARFGRVLRAWEGGIEVRSPPPGLPVVHGPLPMDEARRFLFSVHALIQTVPLLTVYRFYDTAGLAKPDATIGGAARRRRVPAVMLGGWWGPRRPDLILAGLQPGIAPGSGRNTVVDGEDWKRFDTCVEATLLPGSLIYAGRTALHAEDRAFDSGYGAAIFARGSDPQFLLVPKHTALADPREYHLR